MSQSSSVDGVCTAVMEIQRWQREVWKYETFHTFQTFVMTNEQTSSTAEGHEICLKVPGKS